MQDRPTAEVLKEPLPWLEKRLQALDDRLRATGLTVTIREAADDEPYTVTFPPGQAASTNPAELPLGAKVGNGYLLTPSEVAALQRDKRDAVLRLKELRAMYEQGLT